MLCEQRGQQRSLLIFKHLDELESIIRLLIIPNTRRKGDGDLDNDGRQQRDKEVGASQPPIEPAKSLAYAPHITLPLRYCRELPILVCHTIFPLIRSAACQRCGPARHVQLGQWSPA